MIEYSNITIPLVQDFNYVTTETLTEGAANTPTIVLGLTQDFTSTVSFLVKDTFPTFIWGHKVCGVSGPAEVLAVSKYYIEKVQYVDISSPFPIDLVLIKDFSQTVSFIVDTANTSGTILSLELPSSFSVSSLTFVVESL